MKIRIYASVSPEHLREEGEAAGLKGNALDVFTYFRETALNLEVDEDTGLVTSFVSDELDSEEEK